MILVRGFGVFPISQQVMCVISWQKYKNIIHSSGVSDRKNWSIIFE